MKIVTEDKELENDLKIKLIDKFRSLLKLDPNIEGIFKELEKPMIKEGVISEITEDRVEQHILDNMYYNVLYKLDQEYLSGVYKARLKKIKKQNKKKKSNGYGGIVFYLFCSLFESIVGRKK